MSIPQFYREQVGELMDLAERAMTPAERERYFNQAALWHAKAIEAEVRTAALPRTDGETAKPPEPRSWRPPRARPDRLSRQ